MTGFAMHVTLILPTTVPPSITSIAVSPRVKLFAVACTSTCVGAVVTVHDVCVNTSPAASGEARSVTSAMPVSVCKDRAAGKVLAPTGATRKPSPDLLPCSAALTAMVPADSGFGRPLDGVVRTAVGHPPLDQPELFAFLGQRWPTQGHGLAPQHEDH